MDGFSWNLLAGAASIALIHTVVGPDHYLPFVALSRARGWRMTRTLVVTGICGVAHVGSSVLLAGLGLAVGSGLGRLEGIESLRGDLAAWALVAFGGAYAIWGVRQALRHRQGIEPHVHGARFHVHTHGARPHGHEHFREGSLSFWALLLVFVLGPCEPLIPLFMLPASRGRWELAAVAAVVFALVTIVTMMAAVGLAVAGAARLAVPAGLQRWSHAVAGGIIAGCGIAVLTLGL
ncbi:MAG: hypothetical protein PVF68_01485 [Acidobacteriota bacterium]